MAETSYLTNYESIVCQTLVHLREQKGVSQAFLAEKVDVSRPTWSRIESGQTSLSIDQLEMAAQALGVKPHKILEAADLLVEKSEEVQLTSRKSLTANMRSAALAVAAGAIPMMGPLISMALGAKIAAGSAAILNNEDVASVVWDSDQNEEDKDDNDSA
jgi:transcriptional regulator with XRE-family HTH domain